MLVAVVYAAAAAAGLRDPSKFMNCSLHGSGVRLCGMMALEAGFGSGYYQHPNASVHGPLAEGNSTMLGRKTSQNFGLRHEY